MSYDSRPDTYEHIHQVQSLLLAVATELIWRAHVHDASKLVSPEVEVFDEVTPRLAELRYGTEEYEASLREMGTALEHHYAMNQHHPEHYPNGIEGMSLMDVIEMLCDWKAASMRTKDGDVRKSITEYNKGRFGISDQLERLLLNTLDHLHGYVDE